MLQLIRKAAGTHPALRKALRRIVGSWGSRRSSSPGEDALRDRISKLERAFESVINPYINYPGEIVLSNSGYCTCCDSRVTFKADSSWLRDSYICCSCGSIPRERALMYAIALFFPDWREYRIHESSPVDRGASAKLRRDCPGYVATQFFPGMGGGETVSGFQNEDLENQTFADETFDLVVTQDVLEHVFDPDKAFREIARTLKHGGALVCTVPLVNKNRKSEQWAKLVDNKVVFLGTPDYHGSPIDPEGSPVTYRWGYDICERIYTSSRLLPMIFYAESYPLGIKAELIEVLVCRKT